MAWTGAQPMGFDGVSCPFNAILYAAIHLAEVPPMQPDFQPMDTTNGLGSRPDLSALTADEQTAIGAWVACVDAGQSALPPEATADGTAFTGAATTKVTDYLTYFLAPDYMNLKCDKYLDKWAQWRLRSAIMLIRSYDAQTKPKSADASGSGANPLTAPVDNF